MARVYYWHDLMGDFERFAPYRSTLLKLLQGEYDALSLEKLRTPSRHPIFSIRINRSDRILFTTCAGKAYLLDVVLGHHYEDSSFLQRGVLNAFLSTKETCAFEPMGEEKLLIDAAPVDDVLDPIPLVYFQRQFIELNTNQQAAIQATLPTVVSGPAGSGKTCIALSMLVSYVREHRDHPSPPMYICQSNHLCRLMQESWNEIAHERGFRTDVLFITYKSMLLARGLTLADENDFKTWLDALSPKSHDLIRSLKANDLWREFRIRSGYSDEEYTHLGQRRSLISRPEDRRTLCALYSRYLQHLKAKHIFSADLCPLDVDIAYPLVVVDEAQDFSYEQLQSLNQLARGQIAYLLGEHQILFDGKSRLIYLKDMLHKAKLRTCIVHLPASYRCPQRVLDIANALVELKNQCTGGAVDKGESQEMCVSPELLGTTGNATWLHPDDKEAIERLRGTSMHNAQFAVVTDHEHLEQAREQFETSVIFTPSQIKGLEYNTVVLYKLFDSAYFQAAGKKLHTKSTETVTRHRAKSGEADESFLVPFNEAITATTRAKMDLYMIQGTDRSIEPITRALEAACSGACVHPILTTEKTTPEQWKANAEQLLLRGLEEQAQTICIHELGWTALDFRAYVSQRRPRVDSASDSDKAASPAARALVSPKSAESPSTSPKPERRDQKHKIVTLLKPSPQSVRGEPPLDTPKLSPIEQFKAMVRTNKGKSSKKIVQKTVQLMTHLFLNDSHFMADADCRRYLERTLKAAPIFLYHLIITDKGIFKLKELWHKDKPLFLSIPNETWARTFSIEWHHSETSSPLYCLAENEYGQHILYALLLSSPTVISAIPPEIWGPQPKTPEGIAGYSPLYFLSASDMGQRILLSMIDTFPAAVGGISALAWEQKITCVDSVGTSPLYKLCKTEHGASFLLTLLQTHPEIVRAISPTVWTSTKTAKTGAIASPLFQLIGNKEGMRFLQILVQDYPDIICALPADTWIKDLPMPEGEKNLNLLFVLCTQTQGILFLQTLMHACPEVFTTIPGDAWGRPICSPTLENGTSPLCLLTRRPDGINFLRRILFCFPEIFRNIPGEAWGETIKVGDFAGTWPLLMLFTEPKGLELLQLMFEFSPAMMQRIPTSAWGKSLPGSECSPLYLLCEPGEKNHYLCSWLNLSEETFFNIPTTDWAKVRKNSHHSPLSFLTQWPDNLKTLHMIQTKLVRSGINESLCKLVGQVINTFRSQKDRFFPIGASPTPPEDKAPSITMEAHAMEPATSCGK